METIAKYELREVLGQGGMGIVYRAYDPLMDREVALKIIQERALDVPEMKARFVREARMAGKLSHDNIAVIYDLGDAGGKTFIVMEYLPGRNLRSIIDGREQLTLTEKLNFAAQICRGLHFAHVNGIIHRDIKPENIQVLPDRRIKIMDFGIAKPQLQENVPAGTGSNLTLTSAGMRIGTPSYMSPEQVKGLPVDRRSDIFSLGVLLYELFTYTKPFRGDDTTVLYKIVHEDPEPFQLEGSSLSSLLQRVIGSCLEKEPKARYDDCLQILHDLQESRVENTDMQGPVLHPTQHPVGPSVLRMLPGNFVGETVSHFRILEKIGDGGMGTVYKAEDLTLKRTVALKFLLSEQTLNPRAKERFLMEAQAASALEHPNICTIYEIGETGGGLFFICMSYCVGEDLGKILHKRTLDVREALAICVKVARGLSKAHEHGIVHRDIKPANIIVAPSGEAKVVDFGLAKLSGGTQFTRMASVMGTLPYMSPEQIKGGDVDHRTDIWSLGVVLYQALTGKMPFEGAYEAALFYAIVNESPAPPSTLRSSLPPLLDTIIAKALAKKADERYAAMEYLLKDLERVRQEASDSRQFEIGSSPELATLLENGKAYLERRKFSEALSRFEAALKLSPGHPEVESLRARSAQALAQAKEMDDLVRDAGSMFERGKTREARDILLSVTAIDTQHQPALELLERTQKTLEQQERLDKLLLDAEFYIRRGKLVEARESYQKVLEIQPNHKDAIRGLKRTDRKKELETNRGIRATPLPAPRQNRRRLYVPAALILLGLAGALSWYLLRSNGSSLNSDTAAESRPAVTHEEQNLPRQNGLSESPHTEIKPAPVTPPASNAGELGRLVTNARSEMLAEKGRAEKAGAREATSDLYSSAVRQEREANRVAKLGTQEGLTAAASLYAGAREGYRNAADALRLAALKRPTDTRKADIGSVKESPPGSAIDTQTLRTNEKAIQLETNVTAGKEAASHAATPEPPPASEAKHPPASGDGGKETPQGALASNDLNVEVAARNEISKLLEEYRESIEHGDMQRLGQILNLSDQTQRNWSLFFSSSENRKVSIDAVNMDIDHNTARVTFKTKMSFFNNQTNASQSNDYPRQWTLESSNGIWRIVTQK